MLAELTRRAAALEDGASVLDYVESWVASGRTIKSLVAEISGCIGHEIMPASFRRHLVNLCGESEYDAALSRARPAGAQALAEETLSIADGATEEDVQSSRLRITARQWIAERWNPRELGAKQGATVNITIGQLHLDALRRRRLEVPTAIAGAIASSDDYVSAEITEG